MNPAFRLVAACCRWPDDARRTAAIGAAAAGFTDWPGLATLAARHRVEPLVAHGLTTAGFEVPPAIAAAVEAARADTLRDLGESLRIAAAFNQAQIGHRFLKGLPLGIVAYGSATLKRSWDIDLLVLPRQAVAAAECLTALGYEPVVPHRPLDDEEFARWSVVSKEAEYRSPRGTTVELHWRVSDHPRLLAAIDATSPARTVAVLGPNSVQTLAGAPTLAYLAVHGSAHGWFRMKWIADFNALLGTIGEEARDAVLAEASCYGVGQALTAAIDLSRQLFGDELSQGRNNAKRLTSLSLAALTAQDQRDIDRAASRARWRLDGGAAFWLAELRVRLRGTLDRLEHPLPRGFAGLYPVLRVPFWIHRHWSRRRVGDRD